MPISVKSIRFDKYNLWVNLSDSRALGVPLAHFPKLQFASCDQRTNYKISAWGIHWDDINQDISAQDLVDWRAII